jgi:HD-like signal output (HDOD) protein
VDLESLKIRMARSENLPPLPQVASQILKLADNSDTSARDIERAIEKDPAVTGKILRVASSPYYGGANVGTLGRAIGFLGMNQIRSIVVGLAMQQMMNSKSGAQTFSRVDFWRHSLTVATAGRILGKLRLASRADEIYCAGIMHDIGLIALERFLPNQLSLIINQTRSSGLPLETVELDVLGYTHRDVGMILAEQWQLGPVITNAIKYLHEPDEDDTCYETTCIVAVSEVLANRVGCTVCGTREASELDPDLIEAVGLPEAQYDVVIHVLEQEVAKTEESLQLAA